MSTRRALAFSFIDRYAGLIVSILSSMAIARLLTPAEIGTYSVVMVLLGFIATFRDFGAGQYLVQHKSLDEESLRSIWSVQLGLGFGFAALTAASASLVASFYGDARMREIMFVLSLNFAATPFLAYPNAWLVREMRFGVIAWIRFSGAVVHALVSIGLAIAGWGPISLAWANLACTLAGVVMIRLISTAPMPGRPSLRNIGQVVSFGGRLTIVSMMDTLRTGSPELLLGRMQGLAAAGLFSRGQGLVAMFQQLVMNAVGAVSLPYFSREAREGRPLGPAFVRVAELVSGLGWPFFGGLALLAFPAIRILYGDQWDDAVSPTRWLALASGLALPSLICGSPLIAAGALNDLLKGSALSMTLALAALGVGIGHGLEVVAMCLALAALPTAACWLIVARRTLAFSWATLGAAAARSLVLTTTTLISPLLTMMALGWRPENLWLACIIALPGAIIGFLAGARLANHALWEEIARLVTSLRNKTSY